MDATPPEQPSLPPQQPGAVPPFAAPDEGDARMWAMWCHLSALAGYVIPFGHVLGPLIIWQWKKDQFPSIDAHGREAVNFQLSVLIYLIGGGLVAFISAFFCVGFLLIPVLVVIGIGALVLAVIAGLKANEGILYRYPLNLRLIK